MVTFCRPLTLLVVLAGVLCPTTPRVQLQAEQRGDNLAPFVPTPMAVVNAMLTLAEVTADDVVYDLGCGDGRIVVAAAEEYGAKGVGVDYDAKRVAEANARVRQHRVETLVTIIEHDAMTVDISSATVVTLYLLSESNRKLKPRLENLLPPGTRVIAHKFLVPGWKPIKKVTVQQPGTNSHTIFLYRTPGGHALSGTWWWTEQVNGEDQEITLHLREDAKQLAGVVASRNGGAGKPIKLIERAGNIINIEIDARSANKVAQTVFTGELLGDRIVGKAATDGDAKPRYWQARRRAVNVDGTWVWTDAGERVTLRLKRTTTRIDGEMNVHGQPASVSRISTVGSRLEFEVRIGNGTSRQLLRYRGWIEGDAIVGTVQAARPNARPKPWRAQRVGPGSDT